MIELRFGECKSGYTKNIKGRKNNMERLPVTNPQSIINGLKNERQVLFNLHRLYKDLGREDMLKKIEDRLITIGNILKEVKL